MQKEFVSIERAIILIFISKKNTLLVFIFEQQKNINCAKKGLFETKNTNKT